MTSPPIRSLLNWSWAEADQLLVAAADLAALIALTDNRHYLIDIDTPDDMVRFKQETGMELRWTAGE